MTREVGSWCAVGRLHGDDEIPWSSTGMNDLGRSTSIQAVRASRASEGITIVHQWWAVYSRNESYEFSSHVIPRLNQRKKKNFDSPWCALAFRNSRAIAGLNVSELRAEKRTRRRS